MADLIIANKSDLTDIADAVREKTGETSPLSLNDMANEIRTLSVGGSGGVSVQADWNQNDEAAPDYVKNRTHWIENSYVIALPETELEVRSGSVDLYEVAVSGLSPNAHCVVTIDGVSYEATAIHGVFNSYEWYVIGNGELIGEGSSDSDLPFGIFVDKYNENYMTIADNKTGSITLKIEVVGEYVHKIPEIYLPEKIGVSGTGTYSEIFNNLNDNIASGDYSHAENFKSTASGYSSHAEGLNTVASGYGTHTEGANTVANGAYAHAEGYYTEANGVQSHVEGEGTIASGRNQHVSGSYNIADTTSLVIVGNGTASNIKSNAYKLTKNGDGYYSGDVFVTSENLKVATEKYVDDIIASKAVRYDADQELNANELNQVRKNLRFIGKDVAGQEFTIDGATIVASDHAEIFGDYENNIAVGQWSIAEGSNTVAKGKVSHAEGAFSQALVDGTHVEGYGTKATGYWSHAEGEMTVVSSYASHAEGSYCTMPDGTKRYSTAAGYASHTEGGGCHTTGVASHAEGIGTTASGRCAHVEGFYTVASGKSQHVEGVANIEDTEDKYIHIAGNGTLPTDRSNAYTLDWAGNGWFSGNVEATAIILRSSTEGSTKTFKLTINDSGELSIVENV